MTESNKQTNNLLQIGIVREEKNPPDTRVPLTPDQCRQLLDAYGNSLQISVQNSSNRCFTDDAYTAKGINVVNSVNHCHVLFGVKEVPIESLLPNKIYFFFSHTIKMQPYNRKLLQAILQKNIQLIDYEALRDSHARRIIGFGNYAGIVGAHNGLQAYGRRTGKFSLPNAYQIGEYEKLKSHYTNLQLPPIKIVLTGQGRVAKGAEEVLAMAQVKKVSPQEFLQNTYNYPVYTQLRNRHLYQHKNKDIPWNKVDFYANPQNYVSTFAPYTKAADIMINGIYWDNEAPKFFSQADMQQPDFKIVSIADITCDINGSIPATIRPTVIGDPVFGYDPKTGQEAAPYTENVIDVMAVDNLPNELAKDASAHFGRRIIAKIIPELLQLENQTHTNIAQTPILEQASVTKNQQLNGRFTYLQDYLNGK